jgi:hypothetical protein
MPGVKGKSGRKQSTKEYPQYLIRLRPDLKPAVERTHRLLWQHGPKVTQTEAFWAIIEAGCAAIQERLEGRAAPASAQLPLPEISGISQISISKISGEDLGVPGYGFPEDEEELPTGASLTNGTQAPTPQPTTQPAIPLALEPAPKTAHPVDVPQSAETSTERQNGETDIPPYDTSKYVLGKLCPRGHNYHGTGQSLRHRQRHVCLECDAEGARERRKAKRQEQPA